MSKKATIDISLDDKDKIFKSGDVVSGKVTISAIQEIKCNKIIVELIWKTHGRGNRDSEVVDRIRDRESKITLTNHSTHTIDFSFNIPNSPLTYHGHYLNIDYYIRVTLDIPWAIDPEESKEILVQAGKIDNYLPFNYSEEQKKPKNKKKFPLIVTIPLGIIVGALLIALLIFASWLFLIIGIVYGIKRAMKWYAERKIGKVSLDCGNKIIYPNSKLKINLNFTPKEKCQINGIYSELKGFESVTSGSGTNSHTYSHDLHKEKVTLVSNYSCIRGNQLNFSHEIQIPDIQAYSFESSSNRIKWELKVHIDIPGCPDWRETIQLSMYPSLPNDGR
ncbi:hypothetical protein BVX93_00210 [bacterium B13(2017)]|nr:hypothetical protein BVX93_00210 [bacterium B13(2017)]